MTNVEKNMRIDKLLDILLTCSHKTNKDRLFFLETLWGLFRNDPSVVASRMVLKMRRTQK